jgi:hypothetical protein
MEALKEEVYCFKMLLTWCTIKIRGPQLQMVEKPFYGIRLKLYDKMAGS